MILGSSLVSLGDGTLPDNFDGLKSHIDLKWVEKAIRQKGTATVRKRKLPMDVVVWLVIGMALYRDRPIEEVVRRLELVPPDKEGRAQDITKGAIPQARDRVGEKPLKSLFQITSRQWGMESADRLRWRELMVLGLDGSTLSIPDSEENRKEFGGPTTAGDQMGGYPMVRVVGLMVLRSHLLLKVGFADYRTGETTIAKSLLRNLPRRSVVILDRQYADQVMMRQVRSEQEERHWVVRWREDQRWRVWERYGEGDELVELKPSRSAREKYPENPIMMVRAIRYQRKGFRPCILLTTLVDAQAYPAEEIIELYHERWEVELGYDEIKTHTLESMEAIRSRKPERVEQELWGLFIAYNLVRREMEQMAIKWDIPPRRISFRGSLMLMRDLFVWASTASPGSIPKMVERMRLDLRHVILPERRSERRYPRQVKRRTMKYAHKPGKFLI